MVVEDTRLVYAVNCKYHGLRGEQVNELMLAEPCQTVVVLLQTTMLICMHTCAMFIHCSTSLADDVVMTACLLLAAGY